MALTIKNSAYYHFTHDTDDKHKAFIKHAYGKNHVKDIIAENKTDDEPIDLGDEYKWCIGISDVWMHYKLDQRILDEDYSDEWGKLLLKILTY